jgi:beta-N-acetylhexosaminidase
MVMKISLISVFSFATLLGCAQESTSINKGNSPATEDISPAKKRFTLEDFYKTDSHLSLRVEDIFSQLSSEQRVAQLLMPAMGKHGQPKPVIDQLVLEGKIGGILMLNGTKEEFTKWAKEYDSICAKKGLLPFLYSADAEPSLINRKITNTQTVAKANTLKNPKEVAEVARIISEELNAIGINYNFAPVVDMSPNKTVGWRSFGHEPDSVIPWSAEFIRVTQNHNILATAKHFPGHGYVVGDTHEKLVFIDGDMKELVNYPPLIEKGVLSIMIAHIAVKNNPIYSTNGFPATTSRKIVTDLLRDSLNFQGLIVTDALNMGGVKNVPEAEVLAAEAGCDILLMPLDANLAHARLLKKYLAEEKFRKEIDDSVKRIIRMKICLGLM